MRVFGYCRVSTSGQAIDGVSLDAQRAKILAWCAVNDAELVDVFVDAGLSGGKATNRPALQAALDATNKRPAGAKVLADHGVAMKAFQAANG